MCGVGGGLGGLYVAGKGFGVAEAGGEVVEVVVPGLVEAGVGRGDTGDGVEGCVEWLGGCKVGGPVGVGAAYGVGVVEGGGRGACVAWFEGVDAGGLDR